MVYLVDDVLLSLFYLPILYYVFLSNLSFLVLFFSERGVTKLVMQRHRVTRRVMIIWFKLILLIHRSDFRFGKSTMISLFYFSYLLSQNTFKRPASGSWMNEFDNSLPLSYDLYYDNLIMIKAASHSLRKLNLVRR